MNITTTDRCEGLQHRNIALRHVSWRWPWHWADVCDAREAGFSPMVPTTQQNSFSLTFPVQNASLTLT